MLIEYRSNNSGGHWWLDDKDWKALEKANWLVIWADDYYVYKGGEHVYNKNGFPKTTKIPGKFDWVKKDKNGIPRYLGASAKYAYKYFDSMREALQEFEKVTGKDVSEEGCNCCGPPHCFSVLNSKEWVYCSGGECLQYLYDNVPNSLRDSCNNN